MAQEFSTRFARHKDELEWLFMELYHNREGLEVLEREMAEAYNARSAELKALDKARSADPEWYKRGNMFGMTMYTDLFAGNLKELAKKLPYLKEQKLTYLHLMPLLQMPHPHNDGGYAVEDFDTVDPALGTNKDLENLTRELRKAGISLCLDFVMNHTASTHRWAMAAKAGDPWFQAYYHLYDDRTIPNQYEQTVPQVFPNTAPGNFTWCEEMHKWVLTTFHDYQWDLNYANPAVFVDMTKSILHLANLGVEVFRIDAVPYIWKQLGTNCRNLHRSRFNWENAKQRTRKGTLQNQLWQGMEQLRQMRADPCFAPDAWVTTWDSHNPGVLALVRKRGEETLVGLFNFTEYPAGASLDALGGEYHTPEGASVWLADVELEPYQVLLVKNK